MAQSPLVSEIIVAPGNGGIQLDGVRCANVAADDITGLCRLAREEKADLVVPGPELPLTEGITDAMTILGIPCFGPDRFCARMEGSKLFAKQIMEKSGVPTAACAAFNDPDAAREFIRSRGAPLVVKADGLAAGKGVIVAKTTEEALEAVDSIMCRREFGDAGNQVIIEEFLEGEEVSLLALCDGRQAVPLPSAQDHKAAYDGDTGPNTGGMGAYSPAPILPDTGLESMCDTVIRPVLDQLAAQGHPFVGVLYAGLMITARGPRVLEYNVRFGDPECQPLLARLDGDLVEIILACLKGELSADMVRCKPQSAVGIVIASEGYPGKYEKGMPITGLEDAEKLPGVKVFHSGTTLTDGVLRASGGRVLCVTALGEGLEQARSTAYEAVSHVSMPGSRYRSDIGLKGVERLAGIR